MSKADCDANEVLKLQAEVERLRQALEWFADEEMWSHRVRSDGRCVLLWHDERPWEIAQGALTADTGRELLERLRRAEVAFDAAREALEMVEWIEIEDHDFCPWCGNWGVDGHRDDCLRQIALTAAAPPSMRGAKCKHEIRFISFQRETER